MAAPVPAQDVDRHRTTSEWRRLVPVQSRLSGPGSPPGRPRQPGPPTELQRSFHGGHTPATMSAETETEKTTEKETGSWSYLSLASGHLSKHVADRRPVNIRTSEDYAFSASAAVFTWPSSPTTFQNTPGKHNDTGRAHWSRPLNAAHSLLGAAR